jgi:uncharacterized protein (TIGR03435 family)
MLQRVIACLLFCSCSAAFAQSFEAASIKPAAPMPPGRMMIGARGGPETPEPGQMSFINVSLSDLIQNAYDVKNYQISGPGWLESVRFDIEAKVPAGTTKAQSKAMLQNLLAERFKLVLHHSTKEGSIYALMVAKNGPKLKESVDDPNAAPVADRANTPVRVTMGKDGMPQLPPGAGRRGGMMMMAPGGRMRMMVNGATIAKFIDMLGTQLDRPVVDLTGLTGKYDITLDFAPDQAAMQAKMAAMGVGPPPGMTPDGGGGAGAMPDAGPAATIFSALPDQLGLRLDARKGPIDLLVIDSVQKTPTEN